MLFVSRRWLPATIGLAFALGPIARLAAVWLAPGNVVAATVLTPACFDQLGAGAFLAWLWHGRDFGSTKHAWFSRSGLVLLGAVLILLFALRSTAPWAAVLLPLGQSLGFAALVDGAARGFGGLAGAVLTRRPLLWTGKISYGLYLLHNFSHWWAPRILRQLTHYRMAYFHDETLHVLYLIGLSFAAASVSWYLLEHPLNQIKRRFRYTP